MSFLRLDVGARSRFFRAAMQVITCSLFLHHLSEHQAIDLLGRMAEAASHAVLICDLQRSWLGYG